MILTIELNAQEEAWLAAQAQQQGLQPTEVVKRLIDTQLFPAGQREAEQTTPVIDIRNAGAIAMLQSWLEEDATDDPEAILHAEEELIELKRNMNANRAATGERLVFP